MLGHIVTQKQFTQYSINEMVYDINLPTRIHKLHVKCLLHFIWDHYSVSVSVAGYDADYNLGLCLRGGYLFD